MTSKWRVIFTVKNLEAFKHSFKWYWLTKKGFFLKKNRHQYLYLIWRLGPGKDKTDLPTSMRKAPDLKKKFKSLK